VIPCAVSLPSPNSVSSRPPFANMETDLSLWRSWRKNGKNCGLWNADFGVTRDLPDLSVASPRDHSPVRLGPVYPAASPYAVLQKEDLQAAAAERELAAGLKRAFDKSTRSALTLACRSIWERENSAKHRPSMPTTPPCRSTSTVMIGPSLCLSSVFATALSLKRTYTPPDSESISTIGGLALCTNNMCLTELICRH